MHDIQYNHIRQDVNLKLVCWVESMPFKTETRVATSCQLLRRGASRQCQSLHKWNKHENPIHVLRICPVTTAM